MYIYSARPFGLRVVNGKEMVNQKEKEWNGTERNCLDFIVGWIAKRMEKKWE